MSPTPIKLLDASLNVLAEYDDYESSFFTRSLYGPGKFEVKINYNKPNVSLFARDLFVMFGDDGYKAGIISSVTRSVGSSGKLSQSIVIAGVELKGIFERRIVVPAFGDDAYNNNDKTETVIKELIDAQCISHSDANRNFANMTIAADLARGDTIELSSRLKNLQAELVAIAGNTDIGYVAYIDTVTRGIVVDVIVGLYRTASQSVNACAIFSIDNDTAANAKMVDSDAKYRNLIYAGGQGVGADRIILEIDTGTTPTGLERRELFMDARDLSDEADLALRAGQKLAEYGETITLDADSLTYSALEYGTDYDLGDLVTVSAFGVVEDVRISEVKESWAAGKKEIGITFGKPFPNIADQIGSAFTNVLQTSANSEGGANTALRLQAENRLLTYITAKNSLLIPLYIYPSSGGATTQYLNIIGQANAYSVNTYVILNPSSGPGVTVDGNYTNAIDMLHSAGIHVLGYVYTDFPTGVGVGRALADVKADINAWSLLYPTIDGIFVDEMTYVYPLTAYVMTYYQAIARYAHAKGFAPVVANPGCAVSDAYYEALLADVIVAHEGDHWPTEAEISTGSYNTDYPTTTKGLLVYGVSTWLLATFQMAMKYVGMLFCNDGETLPNPWDGVTTKLTDQFQALAKATVSIVQSGKKGSNMIPRGDFTSWPWYETLNGVPTLTKGVNYDASYAITLDALNLAGANVAYVYEAGRAAGSYADYRSELVPIEAGKRYCASVYTGSIRAGNGVYILWYNTALSIIGNSTIDTNVNEATGGNSLDLFKRCASFGDAPVGAAWAAIVIRKTETLAGETSSFMLACRAMLEEVDTLAIDPSPWAPFISSGSVIAAVSSYVPKYLGPLTADPASGMNSGDFYFRNNVTPKKIRRYTTSWADVPSSDPQYAQYIGAALNDIAATDLASGDDGFTYFSNLVAKNLFSRAITILTGGYFSANSDKVRISDSGIEARSVAFGTAPSTGDRRMLITENMVIIQKYSGSAWELSSSASFQMNSSGNIFFGGTSHFIGFVPGSNYAYLGSGIASFRGDGIDLGTDAERWLNLWLDGHASIAKGISATSNVHGDSLTCGGVYTALSAIIADGETIVLNGWAYCASGSNKSLVLSLALRSGTTITLYGGNVMTNAVDSIACASGDATAMRASFAW